MAPRAPRKRRKPTLRALMRHLPVSPAELVRRVGRPSKLTEELLMSFAEGLLTGAPVTAVAKRHGLTRETVRAWRAQGREEREKGEKTIHANFSVLVDMAEGAVEVDGMWGAIARGTATGDPNHVAAGKLALAAIRTRWGQRYEGWRAKTEAAEQPQQGRRRKFDPSRLTPEQLEEYEKLTALATVPEDDEDPEGGPSGS